ncbi:unnamed protein product [Caenorhabditis auriculariae]|uniref:C-type lectin domain-containing protein n=1 Tax=Caenorhabditis auriculariae TaxID=2777116 RepID=A0A8S1HCB7_9PELO|nr:unnamed protein product [Caenorhabditis auriculariae]
MGVFEASSKKHKRHEEMHGAFGFSASILVFFSFFGRIVADKNDCGRGWSRLEKSKSCFMVQTNHLRWAEAERECLSKGGRLSSINDDVENQFVFELARKANLTSPTFWLGRLIRVTRTGAYEWHDGAITRFSEGFREAPTGTDMCLSMWLDFNRPEGSWIEWQCSYTSGYASVCKKTLKKTAFSIPTSPPSPPTTHLSRRCCLQTGCGQRCEPNERCVPDDMNCMWKTCIDHGVGWCLPSV